MVQKSLLLSLLASTALGALQKRYTFPMPASQGSETFDKPHEVAQGETYDGGMKTFGRGLECTGQAEGGEDDTVFLIQEGGTLKNAIIGKDQLEGVYCLGSCTVENVWWESVCEDALSLKGGSSFTISGGGAQHAEDKVIQHNTGGTVNIDGFTVYDFGKLYRSCGNCDEMSKRTVTMSNVVAISGKKLAGVNQNYGDTATIESSVCATDVEGICTAYRGNETGEEPEEISTGPSEACVYTEPLPECS